MQRREVWAKSDFPQQERSLGSRPRGRTTASGARPRPAAFAAVWAIAAPSLGTARPLAGWPAALLRACTLLRAWALLRVWAAPLRGAGLLLRSSVLLPVGVRRRFGILIRSDRRIVLVRLVNDRHRVQHYAIPFLDPLQPHELKADIAARREDTP